MSETRIFRARLVITAATCGIALGVILIELNRPSYAQPAHRQMQVQELGEDVRELRTEFRSMAGTLVDVQKDIALIKGTGAGAVGLLAILQFLNLMAQRGNRHRSQGGGGN